MKGRTKSALRHDGTLSGAVDQDGILVDLTNYEIEKLSRDEVLDFQERRREQIADKEAQAREESDFQIYKERFVAAGGDATDARAAYAAKKKAEAAEAAARIDTEALTSGRRRVRQAL